MADMEVSKKDLTSLMSTIGLKSKEEKGSFLEMCRDIFMRYGSIPTSESDSPISDFRNVYRHQVYRGGAMAYVPVQHLEKAKEDADAHFATSLADYISRLPDNSRQEQEEAQLRQQKETEEGWIVKVNCWRADKFLTLITAHAVRDFDRELRRKFPMDNIKFYVDFQIRKYGEALMPNILNAFEVKIPVDEEKVRAEERCAELRRQCSQVEAQILHKNNSNREAWGVKCQPAVAQFKTMMTSFFNQQPFAPKKKLESFRAETRTKCEEDHGLAQFLTQTLMRVAWETELNMEYTRMEENWTAEWNRALGGIRQFVKAEAQRRFREELNMELEEIGLETLFGQGFLDTMKRVAEEGIESKPAATHTEHESDGNRSDASPSTDSRSLPSSLWIRGEEDKMAFPKHTTLPTLPLKCVNVTIRDSQKSGVLSIYEGEYPNAAVSKLLGVFTVDGVPSAPKGGQALDFTMHVDKLGMLHGKLAIRSTGKSISASFKTSAWCGNEEGNSQESVAAGVSKKRTLGGSMQDSTGCNKKLKKEAGE